MKVFSFVMVAAAIFLLLASAVFARVHWINTADDSSDISIGGSDVLYIDNADDHVGVGTSSPASSLHVVGSGDFSLKDDSGTDPGAVIFRDSSGGQMGVIWVSNDNLYMSSDDSVADLTLDSSGDVGFGTTSPGAKVEVASDKEQVRLSYDDTHYTDVSTTSDGNLTIDPTGDRIYLGVDDGNVDVYIDDGGLLVNNGGSHNVPGDGDVSVADGSVCIGDSGCSPNAGDGYLGVEGDVDLTGLLNIPGAGTTSSTTGHLQLYIQTSSPYGIYEYQPKSLRDYKTNITDLDIGKDRILSLRPVEFRDRQSGDLGVGLIAEETDEIVPEITIYDGEGLPGSVNYLMTGVLALKAVREQQDEILFQERLIDEQDEMIRARSDVISDLEERIERLKRLQGS